MSTWGDLESEVKCLPLDTDTADRLLGGVVPTEDAPPGYGDVALLLAAAADRSTSGDLIDQAQTVAAMAAVVNSSQASPKSLRRSVMPKFKLATAFTAAAIAATTGLAFAGSLPGAAQDVAANMLVKVGVSVPGPNSNSGDHPNVRGSSNSTPVSPSSEGKGSEISALATSTELTGIAKGEAVSTLASDGKSRAGQNGQAGAAHSAPVVTPNAGGTGTADTARDGHGSEGTAKGDEASDGRSAAGSANSANGQSHRP
jgi:hypothetical protein